jgi:hypothetical protein
MSVCIVQKVYRKNLNILCNQTSSCFSKFMIQKQCWIDWIICGDYYMRSAPLWNFTQPLTVIPFRRFGQLIGPIINILTIQEFLTSQCLIDVYREIIKLYNLCCNKYFYNWNTNIVPTLYQVNITSCSSGYHYTCCQLNKSIFPIRTIRIFQASLM